MTRRLLLASAAAALLPSPSSAYMLDTLISAPMRAPASCAHGCALWSDVRSSHSSMAQADVDALWVSHDAQAAAGSACALPGNVGVPMGAMCVCAGTAAAPAHGSGVCSEPDAPTPQAVNLQWGASGAELQVAFVTLDRGAAQLRSPLVELCCEGAACACPAFEGVASMSRGAGTAGCVNVTGAPATRAPEPQDPSRVLSYSFVLLPRSLAPRAAYTYRALPGAEGAAWSEVFTMRAPGLAPGEPQRMALFGDQGLYPYSSVGNLLDDAAGGAIDALIHLGDLAYNLAMANGTRGDAYMYALQPLLATMPWLAVIGNVR